MSHDPLCYMSEGKWDGGCQCELIQRIRLVLLNIKQHENEIEWEQGYKAGYEDAMKDYNMTFEDFKKRNEEWREIMKAMGIERES